MGKINVLDAHVAELIAAGEVVERPASVIKEMVENAIDAGATAVTVEIKNGGVSYMRVADNGSGIAREDVPVAFLRHATSKVSGQSDLEAIGTLGFRGEALASIAAVARVELLTRTQEEAVGTRYVVEGGEEKLLDDAGCPQGSTFLIRDLFYNTPARMKFLKKDVTEANAVAGVLDKIALSHPEISLRFIREGKEQLHTPGDGKLQSAIYAVYGREFTRGLMPVDYTLNHVRVWGFVSRPANSRPNRSMQQFFINGRYVKSRTAMAALEEAFKGSVMVGKFPACVLHLEMSFQAVDVNVHPAKLEVRFVNERPVFDAVYHGVKSALQKEDRPKEVTLKGQRELLRPVSPEIRGEQISLGESPRQEAPAPARPVAAKEALRPMTMPSLTPRRCSRTAAAPPIGLCRLRRRLLRKPPLLRNTSRRSSQQSLPRRNPWRGPSWQKPPPRRFRKKHQLPRSRKRPRRLHRPGLSGRPLAPIFSCSRETISWWSSTSTPPTSDCSMKSSGKRAAAQRPRCSWSRRR